MALIQTEQRNEPACVRLGLHTKRNIIDPMRGTILVIERRSARKYYDWCVRQYIDTLKRKGNHKLARATCH